MNITLTSVNINKPLSEESVCFSAKVCVDDKPAFHAKNYGSGGPNFYDPIGTNDVDRMESRDMIRKAIAWAREATGEDFEPLDLIIARLLDRYEVANILKKKWDTHVMMVEDGTLHELKLAKGQKVTSEHIAKARSLYNKAVILNDMSIEEAVALVLPS